MRTGFGYYRGGVGDGTPVNTADLQKAQSNTIKCPAGSFKVCVQSEMMSCRLLSVLQIVTAAVKKVSRLSTTPSRGLC